MALGDADAFSSVIMGQIAALGAQVADNATEVAEATADLTKTIMNEGSTTRFNLANVERDLQNRVHEARIEALKTNLDTSKYLADKTDSVKEKISAFERNVDMNFCELKSEGFKNTQAILNQLASNKADALKDELDETRLELWNGKNATNFALQNQEIASLKNMINSVEQTQKFSSKTVQFGAGNVALPTQTANQG